MTIFEVEYRVEGYQMADVFRPGVRWGRKIFHVDSEKLGTEDVLEIKQAAIGTAPKGYRFHHIKALGAPTDTEAK